MTKLENKRNTSCGAKKLYMYLHVHLCHINFFNGCILYILFVVVKYTSCILLTVPPLLQKKS